MNNDVCGLIKEKKALGLENSLQIAINTFGASTVAKEIGVNQAHLSNLRSRGISPTLREKLAEKGVVSQRGKQYRRCAFLGYGKEGKELADLFDQYCEIHHTSLTEIVKRLVEQ